MSEGAPEKADAIFVFAGRESRKRFAVGLFREGLAPRLILSVGRFEWRRFAGLGLPGDGGLTSLVSETRPELRHFFVDVRSDGTRCDRILRGRLGTWSEARALGRLAKREGIERLIVISHREHLARCVLCLRLSLPSSCALTPLASPEEAGEPPTGRGVEAFKLFSYSVLLAPLRLRSPALRQVRIPDIKTRFTLSQPGLREGVRPPEAATAPSPPGVAAEGRAHD